MAGSILIELILSKLPGLIDRTIDLEKFVFLNDMVIQEALMSDDEISKLAKRFMLRNLPKLEYESSSKIDIPEETAETVEFYKTMDPTCVVSTTRSIAGIDPNHFNSYHILFENTRLYTCAESMTYNGYSPQKPYYLTRVYNVNQ